VSFIEEKKGGAEGVLRILCHRGGWGGSSSKSREDNPGIKREFVESSWF